MSEKFKNKIYYLIIAVIAIGALVPFAAQFLLPFYNSEISVAGAEVWNQYVSIILGVVATITSIVSLILGFKSEEQSNATERRTRDLLKEIEGKVDLSLQKQDQLQNSLLRDFSESRKVVSVNLASGKNTSDEEVIN